MDQDKRILGFFGEYRFLSNFWPSPMVIDEKQYATVEHYYQANKATNEEDYEKIRLSPSPGNSKLLGKNIVKREDWEDVKEMTMYFALLNKFEQNKDLADKLIETGDAYLEETNSWGDKYWGVCNGKGKNKLGELLMKIRARLKVEKLLTNG